MGADDSDIHSTQGGGWSTYKRLVLHMLEETHESVRGIQEAVTTLGADLRTYRVWTQDIDERLRADHDRLTTLDDNIRDAIDRLSAAEPLLKEMERQAAGAGARRSSPVDLGGLLVEIWRNPLGKVLYVLLALAIALAAAAGYNLVSDRQFDLDRHLRGEDQAQHPGPSPAP